MSSLFAFALIVSFLAVITHAYDCSKFEAGLGYGIAHNNRGCGRCVCGKDNQPICTFTSALWCPKSPQMVNKCGKPNPGSFFDGCNTCGCEDGKTTFCTLIGCFTSGENRERGVGEKWTQGPNDCAKCVQSVSKMPFCNTDACPSEGQFSDPDKDFPYCSKYEPGLGFYDQNTCQLCFCKKDGSTLCKRTDLWQRECTPNGKSVVNLCNQSNMGKAFWDGCNECECGQSGSWPVGCPNSQNSCTRDRCGGRQAGETWEKDGKKCLCTHHGTDFCVASSPA